MTRSSAHVFVVFGGGGGLNFIWRRLVGELASGIQIFIFGSPLTGHRGGPAGGRDQIHLRRPPFGLNGACFVGPQDAPHRACIWVARVQPPPPPPRSTSRAPNEGSPGAVFGVSFE
jgi:hypothetical protein